MKPFAAFAVLAIVGGLAACQSDSPQYDGVSRFAGNSITAAAPMPGTAMSPGEEPAPPLPDFPAPGPDGPDLSVGADPA